MRCGGSAATRTAATQRTFSPNSGDPGNKEAVCPSSPIPRSCTSNAGGSDPKNFRSSVSYARAHSSGAVSYTHLDVYKRQEQGQWYGMPATLVRNDRGEDCPEGQLTAEKVSCGNR